MWTLEFEGEKIETDWDLAPGFYRDYPMLSFSRCYALPTHYDTRLCHFRPFEPGGIAGEIMPVDAEHPANARLIWWWIDREERPVITAAFSVKEFPAGVL